MHHRELALENGDSAAVIVIVHTEVGTAGGLSSEIAAGDAEIIAARGVHVERSCALPENEPSRQRAILKRKIEKFEDRIIVYKSHCTIFEFHFGATIISGQHIVLTNREIQLSPFPIGLVVGQRVTLGIAQDSYISLHQAEADDTGVAGGCINWMKSDRKHTNDENERGAEKSAESHGYLCRARGRSTAKEEDGRAPGTIRYGLSRGRGRQDLLKSGVNSRPGNRFEVSCEAISSATARNVRKNSSYWRGRDSPANSSA